MSESLFLLYNDKTEKYFSMLGWIDDPHKAIRYGLSDITAYKARHTQRNPDFRFVPYSSNMVTPTKYIFELTLSGRAAVICASSAEEAYQNANMLERTGEWNQAEIHILCRVPTTRTSRIIALEKSLCNF